ncbi:MAG: hypothetical protein R2771_00970 [Saprospiraceae bacterium]
MYPETKKKYLLAGIFAITDVYTPIPERLKDWVINPKSNGYESLHNTSSLQGICRTKLVKLKGWMKSLERGLCCPLEIQRK